MRRNRRVRQIREKRKVEVRIVIRKEANLEIFNKSSHLLLIEQQGRYGDQRGAAFRNAFSEVELRQNFRSQQRGSQIVHQLHRALGTRQQQDNHGKQNQQRRRVGAG